MAHEHQFQEKRLLRTIQWKKTQIATLYRIILPDGRTKYNLQVRDAGREHPFIDRIFTRQEQAEDFLENKLMKKEVPI